MEIGEKEFTFDGTRIFNSPYFIIRGKQSQELVREGIVVEETLIHNKSLDMGRVTRRPDFVCSMGTSLNEKRFALNDHYDKSSYLTKTKRPKAFVDFSRVVEREKDLIQKGGDTRIELGGKSQKFYDVNLQLHQGMSRLNVGIPKLKKVTDR